jgi:hypothetical protein
MFGGRLMVSNIHERVLCSNVQKAQPLIDKLASDEDLLWPNEHWPTIRFDHGLKVGSIGGHGPIRYQIEEYIPGNMIRFKFISPNGFQGSHELEIEELTPESVKISHRIFMKLSGSAVLTWPLAIRWLHDALIEDSFDKAEAYVSGQHSNKKEWSLYVKMLRKFLTINS